MCISTSSFCIFLPTPTTHTSSPDLVVDPIQVTGFSTVQLTCSARSYPAVTSMSWAPAQSSSTTTTSDGYLFTSSSVLTVPSDCARTYQCTVIQSVPMTTIQATAVACGGTSACVYLCVYLCVYMRVCYLSVCTTGCVCVGGGGGVLCGCCVGVWVC